MPSPPSTKPECIGPSLKYLVIYNPTLKPPKDQSNSAGDDDDAIEQSHILFYTASQRAVARDQMLRQVGLAKALNSFSEMFSADSCDGVHSQKARLIMVEPEPEFWILASLDVPRTARQTQPKDKLPPSSKSKSTDKAKASRWDNHLSEEWDYKENVLFDDDIRTYMLRGYAQFKLLNGTFSSYIEADTRSALEKQLERHFTTWSWNWDVNHLGVRSISSSSTTAPDLFTSKKAVAPDFSEHLGLPLHQSASPGSDSAEVTDSLQKLLDLAPLPLIPLVLCLQPPSVFPPRSNAPVLPESLPRYLLSIIPPPTNMTSKPRRASGASTATLRHPGMSSSAPNSDDPHPSGSSLTAGFLPPLGKLNMGGMTLGNVTSAVNPKKWNWPGYLSFGHSSAASSVAPSRDPSPSRGREAVKQLVAAVTEDIMPVKGSVDLAVEEGAVVAQATVAQPFQPAEHSLAAVIQSLLPPSPTPRGPESTVDVDQSLLDDAISDTGSISESLALPSNPHDVAESTVSDTGTRTESVPEATRVGQPETSQVFEEQSAALDIETPRPLERSLRVKTEEEEDDTSGPEAGPPVDLSQEPNPVDDVRTTSPRIKPTFSYMTIHLDDTSARGNGQDITTNRGKLLYYVRDRLVFALILEGDAIPTPGESTPPEPAACEQVHERLGLLSEALDRWTHSCEAILTGKSQPSDAATQEPQYLANTRHILCDVRRDVTTCSVGFESTSPHFFASKQILSRFATMHEIISRTDGLRWFAARRQITKGSDGGDLAGDKLVRRPGEFEIFAEIGRKDASLVDVEREVDAILQNR
ncbi:hypothetical protein FRB97_002749 [Tulasnella sp. 331]|nr:hypothetical protein FRB97_002749 [Tulasnella sp. 331]